jgi:LPXTG-site transpeptidase (sortase) family protein
MPRIALNLPGMLKFAGVAIFLYLALYPFYPELTYRLKTQTAGEDPAVLIGSNNAPDLSTSSLAPSPGPVAPKANLPLSDPVEEGNRLIIPKIKVDAPIVEGAEADAAMDRGAWLMPQGARPDRTAGNIVITGHRFKYLPPNNTTFYLFHKLKPGDLVAIEWEGVRYDFAVKSIKTVDKTDLSILDPTEKKTLTLFTCEPIFSQEKRLVIKADPI